MSEPERRRAAAGGDGKAIADARVLERLLAACAAGRRDAFAQLYRLCSPRLYALAVRITGERTAAEDVLQDAFVAIWHHAARYNPRRGSPMAWLASIVRYRAVDDLRRNKSRARALRAVADEPAPPAAEIGEGKDAALFRCLDELEPEPRRSIVLAHGFGYSASEIGAELGVPVNTVKSWIRRGLEKLRTCMDG